MGRNSGIADPSRLKPYGGDHKELIRVVIETPKGSRNKFAFNSDEHIFELKKVLPAGMAFPYDFGFVPSTKADDGDPIDVLVLMDEPAFTGCLLSCRAVGVIEGEQEQNGKNLRNDRIIAVDSCAHDWSDVNDVEDLDKRLIEELKQFFTNYHKLSGSRYRVLKVKGREQAKKLVKKCLR